MGSPCGVACLQSSNPRSFSPPHHHNNAQYLYPAVEAVEVAQPGGVDVSSGVCGPDGLKKDADKVVGFVRGAAAAFAAQQRAHAPR